MPAGRPSKYKPEMAEQAAKLCHLGATDADLADFFRVNTTTIWRWQAQFSEFCNALKVAKEEADNNVERSLYQKAVGYSFDTEKLFQFQGKVVRAKVREHVPPSDTACIFWLKNRRKDEWRDRQQHELSGPDGKPIETTVIHDAETFASRMASLAARSVSDAGTESPDSGGEGQS